MGSIQEILNEDYLYGSYVIEFNCLIYKSDIAIDKLFHYFKNTPRQSGTSLYILTCKKTGNLFAFFENIRNVNNCKDYEKMIVNVLNSKVRLCRDEYELKITNTEKYENFHYWLYYCINKNNMWALTPYVDRYKKDDEPDVEEIFCNLNYIEKFANSDKYDVIGKDYEYKNRLFEIQEKTKEDKKQIGKELFIRKLKKHFGFTNNNGEYLSKRVVCDLLDLDYKSKKDIRDLNYILTDYGVSYDRKKMVNKECGIFIGLFLK